MAFEEKIKQSLLLPEDGATFHGRIDRVDGRFGAECWAEIDAG